MRKIVEIKNGKKVCSKCGKEKPVSEFPKSKNLKCGYDSWCRKCKSPSTKAWAKKQTKAKKGQMYRKSIMKKKYGLTETDYLKLISDQGGKCAICPTILSETRICVDHCHTTGKIRGLLCMNCNTGLGHFKDNTELLNSAIQYLQLNLQNQ
jgi:hypothetical protein